MIAILVFSDNVVLPSWGVWLAVLGILAAAITSVVAFTRIVVIPTAEAIAKIKEDYPILISIADRFGADGVETISKEFTAITNSAAVSAANQTAIISQLDNLLRGQKTLEEKVRETRHDIIGVDSTLKMSAAGAGTMIEQMVTTWEELKTVKGHLEELTSQISEIEANKGAKP